LMEARGKKEGKDEPKPSSQVFIRMGYKIVKRGRNARKGQDKKGAEGSKLQSRELE